MPLSPVARLYGICPACYGVFRMVRQADSTTGLASHGGRPTSGTARHFCGGSRGPAWTNLTSTDRHGLQLRALSLENHR